ncbi:MAG: taurine dioxygenase, partial [Gammaproteobacteria bacterium TMED92]
MATEKGGENMANQWQIKRLAGALGAEVSGTDLTTTTNSDIQDIKALLTEHKVLFFPGQNISPEQHVAFGHNFGELENHPNLKNPFTDHPYIFELAATQGG